MARPNKPRRVCRMPIYTHFYAKKPENPACQQGLELSIEEYEAIRLLDYQGLTQQEAAAAARHRPARKSTIAFFHFIFLCFFIPSVSTAFVTKDGSNIKCHPCKSNHFPNENDTNYVEPDISVLCGPGKLIEVIHSQSYNTFLPSKYK